MSKPAHNIKPEVLNKGEVAILLGMGRSTFDRKLPLLKAEGFPNYDHLAGGYYIGAVREWLANRARGVPQSPGNENSDPAQLEDWTDEEA